MSRLFAGTVLTLVATALPAFADRAPSGDERARIEAALTAQGYIHWGSIEFDDEQNEWEVDDTVTATSPTQYDLDLSADTFKVIRCRFDDARNFQVCGLAR